MILQAPRSSGTYTPVHYTTLVRSERREEVPEYLSAARRGGRSLSVGSRSRRAGGCVPFPARSRPVIRSTPRFARLMFPALAAALVAIAPASAQDGPPRPSNKQLGRASCRERVCEAVELSVGPRSIKKKKTD